MLHRSRTGIGIQTFPFPLSLQLRPPLILPLIHNLQQLPRRDAVSANTVDLHVFDESQDLVALGSVAVGEAGHEEREDDELALRVAVADDLAAQAEDLARGPRDFVDGVGGVVQSLGGVHGCVGVDQEGTVKCKGLDLRSIGDRNDGQGEGEGEG